MHLTSPLPSPPLLASSALQVIVDAFDPAILASDVVTRVIDLLLTPEQALHDILIPLQLHISGGPRTIHGARRVQGLQGLGDSHCPLRCFCARFSYNCPRPLPPEPEPVSPTPPAKPLPLCVL